MPAVGVLILELRLDEAHSLKDKRHYVKSLKDRLRSKFNVAVAEIDAQDLWQRGVVAVVTVSGDRAHAAQVLENVERVIRVSEEEMRQAMKIYFTDTHNVVEGAGAAGLAAALKEKEMLRGKRVGLVATGGNVDHDVFARVLLD